MTEFSQQNHYEVLQISPTADPLIITKVYRLLAAYYHPDNKQTGDEEKFKRILGAYEVLSDPARRARYDQERPDFGHSDDMNVNGSKTERNAKRPADSRTDRGSGASSNGNGLSERELRKQLLLALYDVRRNNPSHPEMSLLVVSELLGCPVTALEFSNWYLKEKGLIKISESADFSITIAGVDYVESELLKGEEQSNFLALPEVGS